MKFEIVGKTYRINKTDLEKVAQASFSVLGKEKDDYIELIFVSREGIRKLNREYRKVDKTTDVLSFGLDSQPLMGQLFICYTKAREQAAQSNIKLEEEVTRLLIHGFVHLYGFDHQTTVEKGEMENLEKIILERTKS